VQDMKVLLRLLYTASYIQIDGQFLEKPQLLCLLRLADAYEMTDCVVECALALCPVADYDEAVQIRPAIPDSVLSHKGLAPLLKEGGDVIAKALPSIDALWTPGVNSSDRQGVAFNRRFVDAGSELVRPLTGVEIGRDNTRASYPGYGSCTLLPEPQDQEREPYLYA